MASNTMVVRDKTAIKGATGENNPDSCRETKMIKTLTILHSGFFQTNFLAGIQKPASSRCSEYRSSLQNETRNLGWSPSEINRQTIFKINKN